jgi:hypothetical protein
MSDLESTHARHRLIRALAIWLVVPSVGASLIVLIGVHLGARHPDAWYTAVARTIGAWF